jgi:uncharacterized protein YbcI
MRARGETNTQADTVARSDPRFRDETRSQGEIEAAVCDGISRFQQEFIGRGPRDIHAHLVGTLLVVRLQGVLTPAERQLISPRVEAGGAAGTATPGTATPGTAAAKTGASGRVAPAAVEHDNGNGRALLKQVRAHMVATGRPRLETLVETATGVPLVSVHHDISTVTGEEVLVFSLGAAPACRPRRTTPRKID